MGFDAGEWQYIAGNLSEWESHETDFAEAGVPQKSSGLKGN